MSQPSLPLLSLVVPCYNEEEVFPALEKALADLGTIMAGRAQLEFVLVNDGSRDTTWQQMTDFANRDNRVRAVNLSRNFGHQMAVTCGCDLAQGDAVVTLDADLQDPPEVVAQMFEAYLSGADVVFAVRRSRDGETAFKLGTAALFYRLLRWMAPEAGPADAGDFRLMSRRAVDGLRGMRERHRYIRGLAGWVGFRTATVEYERAPRAAGHTKYTLLKMSKLAFDAMFSFSIFPLRLAFLSALVASLPIWIYLVYATLRTLLGGAALEPGWASLLASITLFGALILISLGVVGEYVGRIYEQVKQRPLYLVQECLPPNFEIPERNSNQ
jgi:glycosyltransferase involved in cell wall biosynthesis